MTRYIVIHEPNIKEMTKNHKYKLKRAIVQLELPRKKYLNKGFWLKTFACRAKNAVDKHVIGEHKEDVVLINDVYAG